MRWLFLLTFLLTCNQCDHMAALIVQYLAINSSENWHIRIK